MQIPRIVIDDYTARLNTISESTKAVIRETLEGIEFESIADLRQQLIELLEPILGASTDIAAAYAAETYDEIRTLSTGSALGTDTESCRNPEATAGFIRYIVGQVKDDGIKDILPAILSRSDYEIKRAAGDCVYHNGNNDPLEPRFARVPSRSETCAFCFMLASRGFEYHTAESAGSDGHYHPNCDCRIVPGFAGMDVEGYDPDALYKQYLKCREAVEDGYGQASTKDILSEISKRDPSWLYGEKSGNAVFENRFIEPHEFNAYHAMMRNGLNFTVKAVDESARKRGKATPDVLMGGQRWELKCPTGDNAKKTIGRNLNKAVKQLSNADPPAKRINIILSGIETDIPEDQIIYLIKRKMDERKIDELLYITKSLNLMRFKKT